MDDLKVRNPRYAQGGGRPSLIFERGDTGETVELLPDWKPAFRRAGLVWVGGEDLPPRRVEVDPGVFRETAPGLTDDPAVVALMGRFRRDLDAGTWRPGPVADEPVALDAVRRHLGIKHPPGG